MEITVLKEDKDLLEIEIEGEDFTLCNVLRSELWNHDVDAAAYRVDHPLIGEPVFMVSGKNPKGKLIKAADSLRKMFGSLRDDFNKMLK